MWAIHPLRTLFARRNSQPQPSQPSLRSQHTAHLLDQQQLQTNPDPSVLYLWFQRIPLAAQPRPPALLQQDLSPRAWKAIQLAHYYGVTVQPVDAWRAPATRGDLFYIATISPYAPNDDSFHEPGSHWMVRVSRQYPIEIACHCPLGKRQKACGHAGAVLWMLLAS